MSQSFWMEIAATAANQGPRYSCVVSNLSPAARCICQLEGTTWMWPRKPTVAAKGGGGVS